MTESQSQATAVVDVDAWEKLLQENYGRYDTCKETCSFYDQLKDGKIHSSVVDMFRDNRERQTLDYVKQARENFGRLDKAVLGIWDVLDQLDHLEFDKDTVQLQQKVHAFQMAEAMRREGMPRWMILTGLIHDLGKYLYVLGEKQWTVSVLIDDVCMHMHLYTIARSLVIHSLWVASMTIVFFSLSFLTRTQTPIILFMALIMAYINQTVALPMCI